MDRIEENQLKAQTTERVRRSTENSGISEAETESSPDTRHLLSQSLSNTVGAQVWFDIPIVLTILLLGAYGLSLRATGGNLYVPLAILGAYAGITLLQSSATPGLKRFNWSWRKKLRFAGFLRGKDASEPATHYYLPISNLFIDLAFATAVSLVDASVNYVITAILLTLAGVRFLANIAGRPTPLILLPAALPVAFIFLELFNIYDRRPTNQELVSEVLVISCCLIIAHSFFRRLNPRIAESTALAAALAESNKSLVESRERLEQDAEHMAEQLLRLDLLQDSIRAMNSAVELDDLLSMVVDNAVRVLKAEQSSIGLVDPKSGELVIRAATGVDASQLRRRRFLPGVGVAGWVLQHGEPLMVGDVQLDSQYITPYDPDTADEMSRPTRSMLCVPLTVERKVIGTLCVTHSQPDALSAEDQSLLTGFADQAALAVHKSQLLDLRTRQSTELKRRGRLISSLHSISQSVLSSLELPRVLDTIISRINELSNFDYGIIYLFDDKSGLHAPVATNRSDLPSEQSHLLDLREGTHAMELWERAKRKRVAQARIGNMWVMCIALVNLNEPVGCILLARESSHPFTPLDRDTAEKLAEAATIAIVNARLFSTVTLQQQQTAAQYRMMLQVNAATNRKHLAQIICTELGQMAGARSAALLLEDREQATFKVWAASGEWAGARLGDISISAQGDPFVSSALAALQPAGSVELIVIQNTPYEVARSTGSMECITLPVAQGQRLYGLLVLEPGETPLIPDEAREMVRLAISHSAAALERDDLQEETLASARLSSMLYSIAAEVQTSLDPSKVVQMTVNGAMEVLPILSCEVYTYSDDRKQLRRSNMAVASTDHDTEWLLGPAAISIGSDLTLPDLLRSPGLVEDCTLLPPTTDGATLEPTQPATRHSSLVTHHSSPESVTVLRGRLMGSNEPIGVMRLTTALPVQEFIHRYATFCQTLMTHSGGAIERSRLYTTVLSQAQILQQRAQQLTDILNLGTLSMASASTAEASLTSLIALLATGIARSLDFAYVRVGEIGPDSSNQEIWASADADWSGVSGITSRALSLDSLESLIEAGEPLPTDVRGAYLDETILATVLPGQPRTQPGVKPRQLVLILLESTGGGTLGYVLAAQKSNSDLGDLLEVLSIFAQRTALVIENHRIYNQLLDSKRKIEAVVLSIGDGVIVTDAALNVLITNSMADELLGVPSVLSHGQPLKRLAQNEKLTQLLQDCVANSSHGSMDVNFTIGKDTHTYEAIAHAITTPNMGVVGAVVTLRDVTVARATERAKSDFLSIVSHELRTPLNSVLGFLDIILMGKTGPLTELQTDFLDTARQEAGVLQRLINDLLDYSQINSGILRMDMAPMDISSVINRVVNQFIPRATEDELNIVNNVPPGVVITGDEVRLEQVFKNLLDNAAKCTDPGGEISFGCRLSGQTVTISVSDTGCGIPAAQIDKVFDRFYQAENTSKRRKRGLGLGLPTCKSIVEGHGGRIKIESEVGVGTTVHVDLEKFDPASRLIEADAGPRKGNHTDSHTKTLLRHP